MKGFGTFRGMSVRAIFPTVGTVRNGYRKEAIGATPPIDSRPQARSPVATIPVPRFTMSNPYYQQYQQQQQQQQQQQSQDVNPYHQPYQGPMYPIAGSSSGHTAPVPANAYEYDVGILAQQSVYVPGAMIDKRGGAGGKLAKGGKRTTVLRKGAGTVYEDQTLLEWNPGENDAELPRWSYADRVRSLVPSVRRRFKQRRF